MDQLQYERDGGRAVLTLDNPESRNALTLEMAEAIRGRLREVPETDARCVVIRGTDGAFCAGGDIDAMLEGLSTDADVETMVEEVAGPVSRTVQDIYRCPLPTVAMVDGPAYGAGAAMAVACDLVLASERAEFSFGFQRIGLSVDSGTSYLLPRLVGESVAMELVLTDTALDAHEAADLNLVHEVFPTGDLDERAESVVESLATGPTVALSNTKRLVQHGLDRTIEAAIDHEVESLTETFATRDFAEGVSAFAADRDPEFEGQ